jgi:hypothetical protein
MRNHSNPNDQNGEHRVDFAAARKAAPLTWFFERTLGAQPKLMSGTIRYHICPDPKCGEASKHSVKVSVQDEKWMCFACRKHGDVIEAAALYWGVSIRIAGMQLLGTDINQIASYVPPKAQPKVNRDDEVLAFVIQRLVSNARPLDMAVVEYLSGRRIPEVVTREACKRGLLISLPSEPNRAKDYLFDTVGRDALVEGGFMKKDGKAPAIMFRPLVFIGHGMKSAEFRLARPKEPNEIKSLRYGSAVPWAWQGPDTDRILITEGCIDLLSAVALGTKRSIIALPGCENWQPDWFLKLKGRNVLLALDNDGPGKAARERLVPILKEIGAQVGIYELPPDAEDLNEQLMLSN